MNYFKPIVGKVVSVLVCDVPRSIASSPKDEILIHMAGVVGDKHYGSTFPSNARYPMYPRRTEIRNSRQVSIISVEELEKTAALLNIDRLDPEWYGANLVISGITSLTELPPGTRLTFPNGVVLVGNGENDPCMNVGRIVQENFPDRKNLGPEFVKAAISLRGITAWVEHPGSIAKSDIVQVNIPRLYDYAKRISE